MYRDAWMELVHVTTSACLTPQMLGYHGTGCKCAWIVTAKLHCYLTSDSSHATVTAEDIDSMWTH